MADMLKAKVALASRHRIDACLVEAMVVPDANHDVCVCRLGLIWAAACSCSYCCCRTSSVGPPAVPLRTADFSLCSIPITLFIFIFIFLGILELLIRQ